MLSAREDGGDRSALLGVQFELVIEAIQHVMRLGLRMRRGPPLFVCDADRNPRCQGQRKKKCPLRPRRYRHDHCPGGRSNVPIAGGVFDIEIALPTLSVGVIRRAHSAARLAADELRDKAARDTTERPHTSEAAIQPARDWATHSKAPRLDERVAFSATRRASASQCAGSSRTASVSKNSDIIGFPFVAKYAA